MGTPPRGLRVAGDADGDASDLVIVQRSSGARRLAAAVLLVAGLGALAAAWVAELARVGSTQLGGWLGLATPVVFVAAFPLLTWLFNRTEVRASSTLAKCRHRPWQTFFDRSAEREDTAQLFSTQVKKPGLMRGRCQVWQLFRNGAAWALVDGLETAEQALYIEQALERKLGLPDQAVAGELRPVPRAGAAGPTLDVTQRKGSSRGRSGCLVLLGAGFVIGMGLAFASMTLAHDGTDLGKVAADESSHSTTVQVPEDSRHLAFFLRSSLRCEGQLCVPAHGRPRLPSWYAPRFAVEITVEHAGRRLWTQRCDPADYQRPSSDRRTYGTGEFSYAFETRVRMNDCTFSVPEAGSYVIHARRVPSGKTPATAWYQVGGARFGSRARFTRTTLVPAAYRSEAAAGD